MTLACSEDVSENSSTNTTEIIDQSMSNILSDMQMDAALEDTTSCQTYAMQALNTCFEEYSHYVLRCQLDDTSCDRNYDETTILNTLDLTLRNQCQDQEIARLNLNELSERLQNACTSESSSLAWRVFGGPQTSVWTNATDDSQQCLKKAHQIGIDLVTHSLQLITDCLANEECDATQISNIRTEKQSEAIESLKDSCNTLENLIAVNPKQFIHKANYQSDCITATVYEDPSPLSLTCGPSYSKFDTPRGEWTQVMVDGDTWGTQCGDGSEYAFYIKWSTDDEKLDQLLIGLQGGGVCVFEEDCLAKKESYPGLFTAMDDMPFGAGIASTDLAVSPFADWTQVYLPYCTQDVFAGGGQIEDLGTLQLPRYGSVNLRAALTMIRDTLWKKMDQTPKGFRPDQLIAMFGGWSAGAYGTLYNYHWLLDDLQWPRTTAFPDAGLALDNGSPLGVYGLGLVKIPAWGTQQYLPPYCFAAECAIGPNLYRAISPRLKQVPEQQMMILTNPRDQIQQNDAYFMDEALWINTMRQTYCDTKDLPGISYYITSITDESVHVVSVRDELWLGSVDGEVMKDWLWGAIINPNQVQNRAEESNFAMTVPGVLPYPCEVAP